MSIFNKLVAERVNIALSHKFRCVLADPESGREMDRDERRKALTIMFGEIAKGMGVDRFAETPVERLDQFAVMSVVKNHDTAGMLRSLMNSFMIAYSNPETADRAFAVLVQMEALRAEVADDRGQSSQNKLLLDAFKELDQILSQKYPDHTITTPCYRILVGADRLFVMSPKPIMYLPVDINGVIIEPLAGDLAATAH